MLQENKKGLSSQHKSRDGSLAKAYLSGHYILNLVREFFGVSYATVGRAVKKMESEGKQGGLLIACVRCETLWFIAYRQGIFANTRLSY